MVCLGLEPWAAGQQAQTDPLSYGGTPSVAILCSGQCSCRKRQRSEFESLYIGVLEINKNMQKHGRGWTIFKKNFLAQNLVQHDKIRFQESAYLKQLKFPNCIKMLPGWPPQLRGFVCAYHPAAPGSNPKHTIYAFFN